MQWKNANICCTKARSSVPVVCAVDWSLANGFPSAVWVCVLSPFPPYLIPSLFPFPSRLRRRRFIAAVPPPEVRCGWSSASSPVSLLQVAMDGGSSTVNCSFTAIQQCSSEITCDSHLLDSFRKSMRQKIWQLDALLLSGAILAAVIVGIGVFGQRYRHHRFTRFIFIGATTLFLPVVSTVVSMGQGDNGHVIDKINPYVGLAASCVPVDDSILVTVWASLVQIIMINTSAVVAVTDREGTYIGPPLDLLVQSFWTFYVGASYLINVQEIFITEPEDLLQISSEAIPFALTCAKIVFKYYAFQMARQSFALGHNPHLISAYMQQQPPPRRAGTREREPMAAVDGDVPPPLVVMGEKKSHVVNKPHGYVFKDVIDSSVTTIDGVWNLDTTSIFPMSTLRRLQDLCLSFAMFKLLRCRFARFNVSNTAGSNNDKNFTFFWSLLLKDRGHDRVFKVISDEISFVHDYYYSSIPISYSRSWLPIMDLFISLLSISYCISAATSLIIMIVKLDRDELKQISCTVSCSKNSLQSESHFEEFGSLFFDLVPIFILLVFVVISEVREMASYICGNWTKVAVVCRLLNGGTSSQCMQKCADFVLHHKCKLMRHWDQKIGQCSVLMLQPRATAPRVLVWRLFHLPDQKSKIKVPEAAKVCIIEALRNSRNGHLSNGTACLHRRGQVGQRFLSVWACDNKSTSCTILTWHIATSILEVRCPNDVQDDDQEQQSSSSSSVSNTSYKTVATILSRYCAYLVTWCPELLPDDEAWSKSLYEDVKKDVASALAGYAAAGSLTPEARCQKLIASLINNAKQDESKYGARLGEQLVELMVEAEDTAAAWKLVAEFWSEMILYVAPSNKFKGHKEAIARGGELITLLWVLLFHAGIVSRPGEDDAAATSGGVV